MVLGGTKSESTHGVSFYPDTLHTALLTSISFSHASGPSSTKQPWYSSKSEVGWDLDSMAEMRKQ